MNESKDAITPVNELIEALNEREAGYKKAAELVNDVNTGQIFKKYIDQSAKFAEDLLRFSNENTRREIGTGGLSALFRGWAGLKAGVTGNDKEAIFQWCKTGEETALKIYETTLTTGLPKEVDSVARQQYADIQKSLQEINNLVI